MTSALPLPSEFLHHASVCITFHFQISQGRRSHHHSNRGDDWGRRRETGFSANTRLCSSWHQGIQGQSYEFNILLSEARPFIQSVKRDSSLQHFVLSRTELMRTASGTESVTLLTYDYKFCMKSKFALFSCIFVVGNAFSAAEESVEPSAVEGTLQWARREKLDSWAPQIPQLWPQDSTEVWQWWVSVLSLNRGNGFLSLKLKSFL